MDDLRDALGLGPVVPEPDFVIAMVQRTRWQWADPLQAILRFGGWTIDGVVNDAETARAVRQLWKVWKLAHGYRSASLRRAPAKPAAAAVIRGRGASPPPCGASPRTPGGDPTAR